MATGTVLSGSKKTHTKSKNPGLTAQQQRLRQRDGKLEEDVGVSDDSSSRRSSPQLPGYVRFDNDNGKVRIVVDSNTSRFEVRELKRKLVSELDQVRSLRRRLESIDTARLKNGVNNDDAGGGGGGSVGGGGLNNRAGTLARVNSEVSYVGPMNSRRPVGDNFVDKEKRNVKMGSYAVLGKEKSSKGEGHKNVKPTSVGGGVFRKKSSVGGGGGKKYEGEELAGSGAVVDKFPKELFRKCDDLLGMLMKHQYGWVFNNPVDAKKLKLYDYYDIIKNPMDLGTVKIRLSKNWYKSPKEFAEDVRLTFNNAMTYNEKGQDVHAMADVLLKLFEEKWAPIKAKCNFEERSKMQHNASSRVPTSKKGSAPPAAECVLSSTPASIPTTTTPPQMPPDARILDEPVRDSELNSANVATCEDQMPPLEKPKAKASEMRDMTFEEKQRLSIDLMNLPSDELEGIVQIIRNRNPGLVQQEDEIEVDIESFDAETLWELDRFLTDYKKSVSINQKKVEHPLHAREEAGHHFQETNVSLGARDRPSEPASGERQVYNDDGSSTSSSSGGGSESSSSDSESRSSLGYGSDAPR